MGDLDLVCLNISWIIRDGLWKVVHLIYGTAPKKIIQLWCILLCLCLLMNEVATHSNALYGSPHLGWLMALLLLWLDLQKRIPIYRTWIESSSICRSFSCHSNGWSSGKLSQNPKDQVPLRLLISIVIAVSTTGLHNWPIYVWLLSRFFFTYINHNIHVVQIERGYKQTIRWTEQHGVPSSTLLNVPFNGSIFTQPLHICLARTYWMMYWINGNPLAAQLIGPSTLLTFGTAAR